MAPTICITILLFLTKLLWYNKFKAVYAIQQLIVLITSGSKDSSLQSQQWPQCWYQNCTSARIKGDISGCTGTKLEGLEQIYYK